jgi:hypothetical protein
MGPDLKARHGKSLILEPSSNLARQAMQQPLHRCIAIKAPAGCAPWAGFRIFPTLTIGWNNSVTW